MSESRRPAPVPPTQVDSSAKQLEASVESMLTGPRRKPLDPSVAQARKQVRAAQAAFQDDLDTLSEATRSAMDIPAKVRKSPVKSAALAGGAGFLLLGGPRRVMGAVISRVAPGRRSRDPYAGLLPDQVERILRDSGAAEVPGVREALARDFAEYLRAKGKAEAKTPTAAASLWRTYDAVVGPLGTVTARLLVERLFAADRKRPNPD
jgi:ElaB/YqjD/DUF883 family membrane-anchored ribosome-binding protein